MEDSRPNATGPGRASGIPKPASRLPMPRSSGLRPVASQGALRASAGQAASATTSGLHNPRIRPTASRDQLRSSTTLQKANQWGKSTSGPRAPVSKNIVGQRAPYVEAGGYRSKTVQGNTESASRKSIGPRRQPSSQFVPATAALQEGVEGSIDEFAPLPPLGSPTKSGFGLQEDQDERRKPRPSLSERTMETLSQLPSSPAIKRRGSNFFETDVSRRPVSQAGSGSSRPGSSYQSEGSGPTGRPQSRTGSNSDFQQELMQPDFRASTNTVRPNSGAIGPGTPAKRTNTIKSLQAPAITPRPLGRTASRPSLSGSVGPLLPSPEKSSELEVPKQGSKTWAARPLKPRGSMNSLFKKPSLAALDKPLSPVDASPRSSRKVSAASVKSSNTSGGEDRNSSGASTTSTALTAESVEEGSLQSSRKSSAALREQIAKAKAAKRAAARQASSNSWTVSEDTSGVPSDSFDYGMVEDPFGQNKFEDSSGKILQSRIETGRTNGRLNIAAMGFKQIPDEVLKMYHLESIGGTGGEWAESVDITRFVAADNELETIDDSFFPDTDPNEAEEDEEGPTHLFLGLDTLDLHGNTLISLPNGLRRLSALASLNLSSNKLTNNCLDIISQITSLRDLKLANNLLYDTLEACFSNLSNLEILDLHGNTISGFPDGLENMSRLRILNINENSFETLPFGVLSKLPLTELQARRNKLTGVLIADDVEELPNLQILDVSSNQLTHLVPPGTGKTVGLPSVHQLTLSINRLQELPDMRAWTSLRTLSADENSIAAVPEGFTTLENLRSVDFTSNDIRTIPAEIGRMDGLGLFRITGNPLREKKFASLTSEELKANLAARLEPAEHEMAGVEVFANGVHVTGPRMINLAAETPKPAEPHDPYDSPSDDDFATPPTSAPNSPLRSRSHTLTEPTWPVKPGGILDRSETQSESLNPVICSKIAAEQTVRELRLYRNKFTTFPEALSFFADNLTSLSMSNNQLAGENFVTEQFELNALKELNLASNQIASLAPLAMNLRAPRLENLDIAFNRISVLPPLRDFFPNLIILSIANNKLGDLEPESISGLKIVNAENNEIPHLNPRIGLLSGISRLDVKGNRFRVPRWDVLEQGTESTLKWLRGRVPAAEIAEWRAATGQTGDGEDFDDLD